MSLNRYNPTTGLLEPIAGGLGMNGFQPKNLASPVTIHGVQKTTVESAIGGLTGAIGTITDAQWAEIQTILGIS